MGWSRSPISLGSLPFFIFWLTFKRAQHIEICPNPTVINNYIDMPDSTMSPEGTMQTTVQQFPASHSQQHFATPEMSHQLVGEFSGNPLQDIRLYGE